MSKPYTCCKEWIKAIAIYVFCVFWYVGLSIVIFVKTQFQNIKQLITRSKQ